MSKSKLKTNSNTANEEITNMAKTNITAHYIVNIDKDNHKNTKIDAYFMDASLMPDII